MLTNSSATIYNFHNGIYYRRFLPAVFWEGNKVARVSASGVEKTDAVLVLIPYDDNYVSPKEWEALTDKSGKYTLQANEKDRLVMGECPYEYSAEHPIRELVEVYDDLIVIKAVDKRLFGSIEMHHFEVSGA